VDYVINALGLPFDALTLEERSLGGSESAAYYLARELARRGHRVSVFTNKQDARSGDGVTYCWAGEVTQETPLGSSFEFYARNTPHDVLVVQRHPMAFTKPFASKVNIWQLHDLALHRTSQYLPQTTWNIDAITTVSQWHKEQVCSVYPVQPGHVFPVRNGVDPKLYTADRCGSTPELPVLPGLRLLYQSRPERGLEHLVRPGGIMERLGKRAHLLVCGYDNTTAEMAPYYAQLGKWAAALPNVHMLGALTKANLASLQQDCDVLCYPTEFAEVSCITAMEAMHAGLPILTSAHAALTETCAGAGGALVPLKDGKADEDAFVQLLQEWSEAMQVGPATWDAMRQKQNDVAKLFTWEHAADELEGVVRQCMGRASSTSLLRHFMKLGDIPAADALADEGTLDINAITIRATRERKEMYAFLRDDEAYREHYDKWENEEFARHTSAERRRDVVGTTSRGQSLQLLLVNAFKELQRPLRVLEYGCSSGHITIGLAKLFPKFDFHGVDIVATGVREAVAWAQADGVGNARFSRADSLAEAAGNKKYDVVIMAEVLEHVRDYRALLEQAQAALEPGGALITTTPYGPWEWLGHEAYKRGREHWQHFDRASLVEIFAGMDPEIICAPAGHAYGRHPIGSWCCRVHPGNKPFGHVNLQRKLRETVPEETVSACIIVKNGERSLRKALDSLVPWVSEVVVGIDHTTDDNTERCVVEFADANPWLPVVSFTVPSPLDVGFAAARNATVERASGDWVLWMDADEELIGGEVLPKLLRNNMHDAYCTAQVHFSVQPAQVLTVDLPSRLFRRGRGIQFHGLVHEHPEVAPGQAIPSALPVGDLAFAHNGYVTEEVRRGRYFRNLPLLLRDVKENPARILNQFLLIRDLAQGIGFELQLNGGRVQPVHVERAQQVVALWRELLGNEKPVSRMLLDAMQYVTLAVEVLGAGFAVNATIEVNKPPLTAKLAVQGKLPTPADFTTLMNRLSKEATANYDSPYF